MKLEHSQPDVNQCHLVALQRIPDKRGNLTVVEGGLHCPFPIQRVFFMQDIASGQERGAHAHRALEQFLICVVGHFTVELSDGKATRTLTLSDASFGLHIPPGIWARQTGFSPDAVCLVLASAPYEEADYIRDYSDYCAFVSKV